jgi:hypothetical protein
MLAFVHLARPKSGQKRRRDRYKQGLKEAFKTAYPDHSPFEAPCYGIVYYFHSAGVDIDADNLSKPVWDALKHAAYGDDAIIRFRQVGILDMNDADFAELDLTGIPDFAADSVSQAIGQARHILYIEIGRLHPGLFKFALGKNSGDPHAHRS